MDTPSHSLDSESTTSGGRVLVFGGGGSSGNAWQIGVMAGLFDAGLDVRTADLTIGTSAGSTSAAQVAGAAPAALYETTQAVRLPAGTRVTDRGRGSSASVTDHLARVRALIDASADMGDFRRRMCAAALANDMTSDESRQEWWRATVAARLTTDRWPDRALQITAVDARTAEPVVFDRDSGVALVDAVAASCAGGFAYRIGDRYFVDGGYRTNAENVELAAGHARVLVLAPFGGRSLVPVTWGTHLAREVEALRAAGSRVELVVPGADAEHLFGPNGMDPSLRPAAARAGYDQATARRDELTAFWH